jgi:hypothetical protein
MPREPELAVTMRQRLLASNASGTCAMTRCAWSAPSSVAQPWNSVPGTAANVPYQSP